MAQATAREELRSMVSNQPIWSTLVIILLAVRFSLVEIREWLWLHFVPHRS
jgi:hypothetical protein